MYYSQLEAVIRIAESLAKMQLKPFATDVHIDEALRLFQVSTLEAAHTGNLAGIINLPLLLFIFIEMHHTDHTLHCKSLVFTLLLQATTAKSILNPR